MDGSSFTTLDETPCAELPVRRLGAGCCGGWELETPGYPISRRQHRTHKQGNYAECANGFSPDSAKF